LETEKQKQTSIGKEKKTTDKLFEASESDGSCVSLFKLQL